MKVLFAALFSLSVLAPAAAHADTVADIACRGFGTTEQNCLNLTGTYGCVWVGCTSSNQVFAGVCHLNQDANSCNSNNAGGQCAWVGCQAPQQN